MNMSYKNEFLDQVHFYLKDSVTKANQINQAWNQIRTYFNELGSSLGKEINLLGDYVEHYDSSELVEFSIREQGFEISKTPFSIYVKTKIHGNYNTVGILEFNDGNVINMKDGLTFIEESLDEWFKSLYGKNLENL